MGLFKKTPEEKFEKALLASSGKKMLKLAEEGMQKAMVNAAYRYHNGFGLKINNTSALFWANKAADENLFGKTTDTVEAYYTKGNITRDLADISAAEECYKKAYEIGKDIEKASYYHECAGLALAILYIENNKNYEEAKSILKELTEKKLPKSLWSFYTGLLLLPSFLYFSYSFVTPLLLNICSVMAHQRSILCNRCETITIVYTIFNYLFQSSIGCFLTFNIMH